MISVSFVQAFDEPPMTPVFSTDIYSSDYIASADKIDKQNSDEFDDEFDDSKEDVHVPDPLYILNYIMYQFALVS